MMHGPGLEDGVAEGFWQTVESIAGDGISAHLAWKDLDDTEKLKWRELAVKAIHDWKMAHGII